MRERAVMWMCRIVFFGILLGLVISAPAITTQAAIPVTTVERASSDYDAGSVRGGSDNVSGASKTSQPTDPSFGQVAGLDAAKSPVARPQRWMQLAEEGSPNLTKEEIDFILRHNGEDVYSVFGKELAHPPTATKNGRTLRVNTIDTYVDAITPTTREAANAARIRAQTGEHLLLVPKPKP